MLTIITMQVDMAHSCGVPVEGELGYVPGVEGEDAERHPGEIAYTTVAEAKDYVAQTGIDFLAVSIGTVHGRMQGEPKLDFQRLQKINEKLGIPLVIHGGTGLSETGGRYKNSRKISVHPQIPRSYQIPLRTRRRRKHDRGGHRAGLDRVRG